MKQFFIACFFFTCLGSVFSQWNSNPAVNTPICIVSGNQYNVDMTTDQKGGAILAWVDQRNSSLQAEIFVQRINALGVVQWTLNGISVCSQDSNQAAVSITTDSAGGAFLAWNDFRNGNRDIYAQSIDSSGQIRWSLNGVPVCVKPYDQRSPKLVANGSGGVIVVWEDSTGTGIYDIYAQKLNSNGTLAWTAAGVPVCAAAGVQASPKLKSDGAGGALIAWHDKRNTIDNDIYCQRINSSGVAQWTANGVLVSGVTGSQKNVKIQSDGQGGAIMAWQDGRANGTDNSGVFAQRVNASGVMQWTANGVAVCTALGSQAEIDMTTQGINGVIITWRDKRNAVDADIYAQKLNLSGVAQWAANGVVVSNAVFDQISPNICADGSGGAIICWVDSVIGSYDIYAQRINGSGIGQWAANGVPVGSAANDQGSPSTVSDGNGGVIFGFQDFRNGTDQNIYAHHLFADGNPTLSITTGLINNSPFCAGASLSVPFTVSSSFIPGNTFTAQLSDASGSFSAPVAIGTITGQNSGSIPVVIPPGTASGTGYRIRVTGNYPVTIGTDNGLNLTINAIPSTPVISPSGSASICSGASVTLTSSSASGNVWSPSGTGQNVQVSTPGTYTVYVVVSGCTSATSQPVVVSSQPIPPAPVISAGGPVVFCSGDSVVLSSSSNSGNVWSPSGSGQNNVVTASGTYSAVVVVQGCTSAVSNPVTVTVNPTPARPVLSPPDSASICSGASVTLTSSSPSGNVWYPSGSGQNNVVNTPGTYTVYVVSGNCTSATSAPVVVSANPVPPVPSITPSGSTTFCAGDSVILMSSSNTGNIWSPSGNGQNIAVTTSGTYTVSVVALGCTSAVSAPVQVIVNTPPAPSIVPSGPTSFCQGDSVILDAGGGYASYSWTGFSQSQTLTVLSSGSYSVTVTDSNSCQGTSSPVLVSVTNNPVAQFTSSPVLTTVTFSDQSMGATSWLWSFGDGNTSTLQNPVHAYANAGTYQVCLSAFAGTCKDSVCHSLTLTSVSSDPMQSSEMKIFPNPSSGEFHLLIPESLTLKITDASGRLIQSFGLDKGSFLIHLEQEPAGVYFLHAESEKWNQTLRLVKLNQ